MTVRKEGLLFPQAYGCGVRARRNLWPDASPEQGAEACCNCTTALPQMPDRSGPFLLVLMVAGSGDSAWPLGVAVQVTAVDTNIPYRFEASPFPVQLFAYALRGSSGGWPTMETRLSPS